MPSAAHQIAIQLLSEQPELINELTEKVLGRSLAGPVRVVDSTARFIETEEARPDLIVDIDSTWAAIEVQNKVDFEKAARWHVMVSIRAHQTGQLGDLIVITSSRRVASWARTVARRRGPLGTLVSLRPVVVLVAGEVVERLLDERQPALAFFAAWAMQGRHGREAQRVVDRAIELSGRLPPELQEPMQRAIIDVLSEKMHAYLRSRAMQTSQLPLGPAAKLLWDEAHAKGQSIGRGEGKAEGKAEAVVGSRFIPRDFFPGCSPR